MAAPPKGNILVLEPNEVTRRLISGILAKSGYAVHEAANGDEAAGHLARRPHVVILDMEAENADHYGFIRKMQRDHGRTQLVALLDRADREAARRRLNMPCLSFVDKPVNPAELVVHIDAFFAGAAAAPAAAEGAEMRAQKEQFMRRAIDLSQQKMEENCGGPFGAVIVRGGKIIGEGWNCVTSTNDPTAHAEMVAIRNATANIKDFKLEGCEIYTSCEPCPMCLAAIYWARIDRIYYANLREDAEKIGFDDAFLYAEVALPENKRSLPAHRLLREEARIVFDSWMKKQDRTQY